MNKRKDEIERKLTVTTQKEIIALSGGTCSICNKPIIVQGKNTDTNPTYNMIGEFAHIVGLQRTAPRHEDLPAEILNDASNYILLCPNCHVKIDKKNSGYTKEKLQNMKHNHEISTLNNISKIINRTKLGGYRSFHDFKGFENYLLDGELPNDDKLISEIKFYKKSIVHLNDLSISVRSAFLNLCQGFADGDKSPMVSKKSYWEDAYGTENDYENITKLLDPLLNADLIDVSEWLHSYTDDEIDPELIIKDWWYDVMNYLKIKNIPLSKVIIERDYTVFDRISNEAMNLL